MTLPPLPYPQFPGNDYTSKDMHDYGQACHDAVIKEIQSRIENMKNAQN